MDQQITERSERSKRPLTKESHEIVENAKAALRRPAIGATVAGVTVLAAGAIWGVTEAVVAGAAAYLVFRSLRKSARKAAAQT